MVLILRNGCGELYLPGEAQPLNVGYDRSLSNPSNAQAFLTDHLKAD
ncbi:hypothetical protein [Pseudomonas capeferrum]